ncbi:probable chitinase 10 [Teleopsis dalmanni]|uniref:probable chitinase 10 n=1 Tax=Teleopsis dalmanni TaxID=139649 RepID=UPI0018CCC94A|nr:probable chitinase 10 [Teleopsis dalmanni]
MIQNMQLPILLVILSISIGFVKCDIFVECNNVEINTYIASTTSCREYIFCNNEDSFMGECGEGDYFDQIYQTCDPEELVDCQIDNNEANNTLTVSSTTSVPIITPPIPFATETTITTASTATGTRETTIIDTSIPTQTARPNFSQFTFPTIPTTVETQNVFPGIGNEINKIVILSECPAVDNREVVGLIPHPKSCSDYFVCFHGNPLPMHCSAMLHFNTRTGRCDYPENAKCRLDFVTAKEQCQRHTTDVYPHPVNCNYFYHCKVGFLLLQQCPFFYGWDIERRTCLPIGQAKCFNNQRRI